MRLPDTGRSCHPRIRPSSLRHYTLDEPALTSPTVGPALDVVRGFSMAAFGAGLVPTITQACTPKARRFLRAPRTDSLEEPANDAELNAALLEDCSVGVLFRADRAVVASEILVSHSGISNDADAARNHVFTLSMTAANVSLFWEHSVGTDVIVTFPTYSLRPFEWTYIVIRKRSTTGPGPAGTTTVDLFVNGVLVSTSAGVINASDGSTGRLRIGHQINGGGFVTGNPGADIAGVYVWGEALSDDEIAEDERRIRRLPYFTRTDLAVVTTDSNGASRNLTNLEGVDFLDSVEVSDDIDQATMTARITMIREQEALELASLKTESKLNLSDPLTPSSYVLPMLREDAPIEVFAARVPLGLRAQAEELALGSVFSGAIDEIDEGGEAISIEARDDGGRLIDTFIEQEVDYSDPLTPFAVEGEMQFILNDNDNDGGNNSVAGLTARTGSYAPITLFTPYAPGWAVLGWRQRREPILPALRTLAGQIGWEVRYVYDPDPNERRWRLAFYEPDRSRVDADVPIVADDIIEVRGLRRSTFGRRTNVRVVYPSSETTLPVPPVPPAGYSVTFGWSDVDGDDNRVSAFVEVQADATIAATGKRQFTEFAEPSSSQIDTVAEAYDMAFGSLRDLEDPGIQADVSFPMLWEAERNDMLRFQPIRRLFTAPQTLALRSLVHRFDETATTTVQLRGKPSVGFKRWLRIEARPGQGKPGVMDPRDALTDVTTGALESVYRNFLDRSSYFTGGKFVQIRNGDFASFSAGKQNPPDGWSVGAGIWTTDIDVEEATNLSGGKAIRFITLTGQLRSDFVPITGADLTPYACEVSWQRVAGDDLVQVDVEWYSITKTLLATQSLSPGVVLGSAFIRADDFPAVPATVGAWFRSRAEGIAPPSSGLARFARIVVRGRLVGGGFSPIIVDDVSFYRAARKTKAAIWDAATTPAWAPFVLPLPGAGSLAANIPICTPPTRAVIAASGDVYDVSRNVPLEVVPTVNGGHMRILESGIWRLHGKFWFVVDGTYDSTDFAGVEFVRNGTYSLVNGQRTGGTVIDSFRFRPLDVSTGLLGAYRAHCETRLNAGDRVTFDFRNYANVVGETITVSPGDTLNPGNNDFTYLHAAQMLAE